jgi:hypothetical protein
MPQDFSYILWSYATSSEAHPRLFSKVSDHTDAMKELSTFLFLPQALSNIVWAYTTAGESYPLIFQKLADVATAKFNDFKPQELSNPSGHMLL